MYKDINIPPTEEKERDAMRGCFGLEGFAIAIWNAMRRCRRLRNLAKDGIDEMEPSNPKLEDVFELYCVRIGQEEDNAAYTPKFKRKREG